MLERNTKTRSRVSPWDGSVVEREMTRKGVEAGGVPDLDRCFHMCVSAKGSK